ncbi:MULTISPECIES: phosphoribosyl-AMP cyclohydrolase [unclassified Pseudoclavibacter]|jgi:phosphoribosyl-AMP cyclohydrolase|uniref:phosphoribosyl-AMP cyclohydrolase n=1 Tax=unclassified Pseudoclavibacter TaxID=2615177 RepID=UPI000CE84948|nr:MULTISPECIES: phosphoribosyl-AMP cyclohydrolase [unclassified Pseudoclavibacter]MBS3177973.1 phosphoribosyl-AMP cyclohydrolase [Pseudoclavibacter sp. Marseille-Q4354]PPG29359.1 phosphoribosyl-AMP cyclohydrolase [Pseudoclavibacter sp. RFBB5]
MSTASFPVPSEQLDQIVARTSFDDRGLVPVIVTQHDTREVLMLAYMNEESLRMTLTEGRVVYWSRSRAELWRKGDTSGNTQRLVSFALDCDADTILIRVDQHGPACHTGTRTCFDGDQQALDFEAHERA